MNASKHPDQPIIIDDQGTARFKVNAIVRYLLDAGPFDMNHLALIPFSDEDRNQFAQLIGYSVSGFGDLSCADPESVDRADSEAERLLQGSETEASTAQVRVFRHDIQRWVEVPEERIAWGPDTKVVTCNADLLCHGNLAGFNHPADAGYVPYLAPADKWAVRISFQGNAPVPDEPEEQRNAMAEDSSDNPIVAKARQVFLKNCPGGTFISVDLRPRDAVAWCHGTLYGHAWKVPVHDAEARRLMGQSEASR